MTMKVLGVFGHELIEREECLLRGWRNGDFGRVLPLDDLAFLHCRRLSLPVLDRSSLVPSSNFSNILSEAKRITQSWLNNVCDASELQELVDIDREAWFDFWTELLFIKDLCETLRSTGVVIVRPVPRRIEFVPAYANSFSTIGPVVFDRIMKSQGLHYSAVSSIDFVDHARKVWRRVRFNLGKVKRMLKYGAENKSSIGGEFEECDVLFVCQEAELYRLREGIDSLRRLGYTVNHSFVQPCNILEAENYRHCFEGIRNEVTRRLRSELTLLGMEFPSELLKQIDYYVSLRWPALLSRSRYWCEVLKVCRPKLIVVTAIHNAESQLPAFEAKRRGVASVCLPHGAVQLPFLNLSAELSLVPNPLQAETWRKYGLSSGVRIRVSDNVIANNEYPVLSSIPEILDGKAGGVNVLYLTNPPGSLNGRCQPGISGQLQEMAMKEICWIASQLDGRNIRFMLKLHPKDLYSLDLLRLQGEASKIVIPPVDMPLGQLLESSHLVVGLNYLGSATLHAMLSGKPFVNYWLDRCSVFYRFGEAADDWESTLYSVSSKVELLRIIEKLCDGSGEIEQIENSNMLGRKYFEPGKDAVSFDAIVRDMVKLGNV